MLYPVEAWAMSKIRPDTASGIFRTQSLKLFLLCHCQTKPLLCTRLVVESNGVAFICEPVNPTAYCAFRELVAGAMRIGN